MRKTIEVVDEFYCNPYERREQALARGSGTSHGPSAGVRRNGDVAEARTRIAALLGDAEASFPELTARLTSVGADGEGNGTALHVYDNRWAALVYLALPEGEFSAGVGFYRPVADTLAPGIRDGSAVDENPHPGHWEETTYVPLTFNRLVLFPGAMAHRYTVRSIDRGPVEDRIAQLFLFDEPDGGR